MQYIFLIDVGYFRIRKINYSNNSAVKEKSNDENW